MQTINATCCARPTARLCSRITVEMAPGPASIGTAFQPDIALVGDARLTLRDLAGLLGFLSL